MHLRDRREIYKLANWQICGWYLYICTAMGPVGPTPLVSCWQWKISRERHAARFFHRDWFTRWNQKIGDAYTPWRGRLTDSSAAMDNIFKGKLHFFSFVLNILTKDIFYLFVFFFGSFSLSPFVIFDYSVDRLPDSNLQSGNNRNEI